MVANTVHNLLDRKGERINCKTKAKIISNGSEREIQIPNLVRTVCPKDDRQGESQQERRESGNKNESQRQRSKGRTVSANIRDLLYSRLI